MPDDLDVSVSTDPVQDDLESLSNFFENKTDAPDAKLPDPVSPEDAQPAEAPDTQTASEADTIEPPTPRTIQDLTPDDILPKSEKPAFWDDKSAAWDSVPEDARGYIQNIDRRLQGERDRTVQRLKDEQAKQLEEHKQTLIGAMKNILAEGGVRPMQGQSPYGPTAMGQGYNPYQSQQQIPQDIDPALAGYLQHVLTPLAQQNQMLNQQLQAVQAQVGNVSAGALQLGREAAVANARNSIGPIFDSYRGPVEQLMDETNYALSPERAFYAIAGPDVIKYALARQGGSQGSQTPQAKPPYSAPATAGRGGEAAPSLTSPEVVSQVLAKAKAAQTPGEADRMLMELLDAQVTEQEQAQAEREARR